MHTRVLVCAGRCETRDCKQSDPLRNSGREQEVLTQRPAGGQAPDSGRRGSAGEGATGAGSRGLHLQAEQDEMNPFLQSRSPSGVHGTTRGKKQGDPRVAPRAGSGPRRLQRRPGRSPRWRNGAHPRAGLDVQLLVTQPDRDTTLMVKGSCLRTHIFLTDAVSTF